MLPDSTAVSGFVGAFLKTAFPHLPPEVLAILVGGLGAILYHFFEKGIGGFLGSSKLAKLNDLWAANSAFVNPLLILLFSHFGTGSLLPGIIAAGLRSFVYQKDISAKGAKLGAIAGLLLMLVVATPSAAEKYTPKPSLLTRTAAVAESTYSRIHLGVGAAYRFEDVSNLKYHEPFFYGAAKFSLTDHLVAKARVSHDFKGLSGPKARPWGGEVGAELVW